MDLSEFARFTISQIRHRRPFDGGADDISVFGTLSNAAHLEVGSRYWLYVEGGFYSPIVDVLSLDRELSTAHLDGLTFSGTPALVVGDSFPILTDYWSPYIYAAVLDAHRA